MFHTARWRNDLCMRPLGVLRAAVEKVERAEALDGAVRRGPTTHPQPVLQVLVEPDGTVLARLPEDG